METKELNFRCVTGGCWAIDLEITIKVPVVEHPVFYDKFLDLKCPICEGLMEETA